MHKTEAFHILKSFFFCAKDRMKNIYIRCIERKWVKYYNKTTIT